MIRKQFGFDAVLVGGLAVALTVGAGVASGQYLVTSFETTADLFTPITNPPPAGTPTVALSSQYGVTQGANSMEVVPTGYTWEWLTKNFGPDTYAQWYGHQTLAFDFTRVTTSAGNYELVAAINAPTTGTNGWTQKQLVNWAWTNGGQNTTQTLTWDYNSLLATSPLPGSGTSADFWQLSFVARTNPTYAPQAGYIDNIRFINPVTPQEYVWAGNGSAAGGTGYWSTVFQDTTWLANGQGAGVEWDSYKKAVFRSSGGTVSVSGTVVARNGIQFDNSGFAIVSDTNPSFSGRVEMAGGTPSANSIAVASGASAAVNLPLIGTNGLTKTGAGTLVLGGISTVSGSAVVSGGTILDTAGRGLPDATIVVAPGGRYETPAGVAVDSAQLKLAGGTLAVQKLNVSSGLDLPVVINNFETVDDLYTATVGMTDIVLSTTAGVTSGSGAMGMTWINGSDYNWTFKVYGAEALEAWKDHKVLAIDVTQVNSGTGGGNIAGNVALNGPMGWNQTGNSTYPRFINYPWLAAGGSTTTTYYWDYSAITATGTDEWFQVNLAGSMGGNWEPQRVYYDNLRVLDPVVPTAVGIGTFVFESGSFASAPDLAVFNGGRMSLPSGSQVAIAVKTLSVTESGAEPAGGGLIDLGAGRIDVQTGGITAADLVADIVAGRGDGSWSGTTGITSTLVAGQVAASLPRAIGWVDDGGGGLSVAYSAPGDTNIDMVVDILDVSNLVASGKYGTGDPATWAEGDFNYDGIVDIQDVADFSASGLYGTGAYGISGAAAAGIAAVPEPPAFAAAMAAAAIGAARLGRGRRRAADPDHAAA